MSDPDDDPDVEQDDSDSPPDAKPSPKTPPVSSKKAPPPAKGGKENKDKSFKGPVDKDGVPIPPPPIIGPDGKEVPRPRDAQGNPLPIYVAEDGKPVFDDKGKPIALKFDKEGRPIPLQVPGSERAPAGNGEGGPPPKAPKKLPAYVFWIGAVDLIVCIVLLAYLIYVIVELTNERKEEIKSAHEKMDSRATNEEIGNAQMFIVQDDSDMPNSAKHAFWYLVATAILLLLGGIFAGLPMFAVKKDRPGFLNIWGAICFFFFLGQAFIFYSTDYETSTVLTGAYFGIRLLFVICILIITCSGDDSGAMGQQYYNPYGGGMIPSAGLGSQYYPGQGQPISSVPGVQVQPASTAPRVQVVQQQPLATTYVYPTTTAMMPAYGGWGYPSYGYGGMGMGYGYGAGWGMYGGSYYGYPYHHHGWYDDDFWW